MNKIKRYVEDINDELEGAKHYIECALEYKAMGNSTRYNAYKEMSVAEIGHAMKLHEFAVQDIEQLKAVYPDIPQDMMDKWEKAHVDYVGRMAWIKQMQNM